jgi:type IV pilus assembly protein PilO
MKVSLAKKLGVLAALILLFAVGFWLFFYSPTEEELEGLKVQYTSLIKEKETANRSKATYEKDRERRDELKKSYGKQIRALPPKAEMPSFLNSLNAQSELVGLEIDSVKPLKEELAEYYARIPVELVLTGSYHQLAKFFYLVGNLDRIINIENIQFRIDSTPESGALLDGSVLATTFRSVGS